MGVPSIPSTGPLAVLVMLAVAGALAAPPALAADLPEGLPVRLDASTTVVVDASENVEPARVKIRLQRYSTPEEIAAQRAALDGGMRPYLEELAKSDLGTVQVSPGATLVVGFASRHEGPAGTVLRIVTTQPLVRPRAGGDYAALVEIRLPFDGQAHGTLAPAIAVGVDERGQPFAVDGPARGWSATLRDVRVAETKPRR